MNETTRNLLKTLVKSSRITEAKLDSLLEAIDLSATKMLTLHQLERAEEPVSLSQLASTMAFVKSNATQVVDSLEKHKLVKRLPAPDDRRCTHLQVTSEGTASCEAAREAIRPLIGRLEQHFTEEELEQFLSLLQRLADVME